MTDNAGTYIYTIGLTVIQEEQPIIFSVRLCSPHAPSNPSLSGSSAIITLLINHPHGQDGWACQWPRSTLCHWEMARGSYLFV